MQKDMIQEITKLVVEALQEEKEQPETNQQHFDADQGRANQQGARAKEVLQTETHPTKQRQDAEIKPVPLHVPADAGEDRLLMEEGAYLQYTPARVAVGRAGPRPRTSTLLQFRYDHAAAVDAVYGEVSQELLDKLDLFTVETKVEEKEMYIRRPDLGRRFSDASKEKIRQQCVHQPTVQIMASNGLSASAVNANLADVYLSLQQSLDNSNIQVGTSFYAHQGRVGLMDDVGEVLEPEVVVYLIGERPGLVSAESLSAYLCYKPRYGTIESDRMVISNIHQGGIPPIEAGAYIGTVIERMLKHQASGVTLIQKEG